MAVRINSSSNTGAPTHIPNTPTGECINPLNVFCSSSGISIVSKSSSIASAKNHNTPTRIGSFIFENVSLPFLNSVDRSSKPNFHATTKGMTKKSTSFNNTAIGPLLMYMIAFCNSPVLPCESTKYKTIAIMQKIKRATITKR